MNSWLDEAIVKFHQRWIEEGAFTENYPKLVKQELALTEKERLLSARLMRVNHAGEVCAQALYLGHASGSGDPYIKAYMHQAAQEEYQHLAWCAKRLRELESHPSYLKTLWFAGAYCIGKIAATFGDTWGLGFVVETERQVEAHLNEHLNRLPPADAISRMILQTMKVDEINHGQKAQEQGAQKLPAAVCLIMRYCSKIMTKLAYWI